VLVYFCYIDNFDGLYGIICL